MQETVEREITRIARDRMGERPASLTALLQHKRMGDGGRTAVLVMKHAMLTGTAYENPGMPDAVENEQLTDLGRRRVSDAIDDVARRLTREDTRVRIAQFADANRPWLEDGNAPSWTLISHPLMVHALMRAGANDLPVTSSESFTVAQGMRVKRLQDLLIGECALDTTNPGRGRVFCDDMGLVMEIADDIPHVARTALVGHPLVDLIELPPSGDAELDAIVAGLLIVEISGTVFQGRPGIMVTLCAATWRPCAPAPPRVNDHAMRLPHKIC